MNKKILFFIIFIIIISFIGNLARKTYIIYKYDKQMKEKIEKLTSIGKMPQDIYLNPSVLTKYDLNGLNNAIDVLKQSGLDAKNVPLIAY